MVIPGMKIAKTYEKEDGKWEGFYLWPDAKVVGYIDKSSQITEYRGGYNGVESCV